MKKYFAIILVCVLTLSLTACGASAPASTNTSSADNSVQNELNEVDNQVVMEPLSNVFGVATSSATGAYATIKISSEVKMDDESAWLGLCPAGKDYITELEADEVDVIWYNADQREDEDAPYVFACDFSSVEDGTYALVVATSDDENIGYVVIQLEMSKAGDNLTFDYTNAKWNERPAN